MKNGINCQRLFVPLQELGEESLNKLYGIYGRPDELQQTGTFLDGGTSGGMEILANLSAKGSLCSHLQGIAQNGEIMQKQVLGNLLRLCGSDLLNESKISRTKIYDSVARQVNLARSRSGVRLTSPRRVCEAMKDYGI